MLGTVSKIWRNEREDGSEYWVLSINGRRYSVFDLDLVKGISEGDFVEFSYAKSGKYRNIVYIKRASPEGFVTADTPVLPPEPIRILRMSCLRTAAELLNGTKLSVQDRLSNLLETATQLEEHVLSGRCCQQHCQEDNEEAGGGS